MEKREKGKGEGEVKSSSCSMLVGRDRNIHASVVSLVNSRLSFSFNQCGCHRICLLGGFPDLVLSLPVAVRRIPILGLSLHLPCCNEPGFVLGH